MALQDRIVELRQKIEHPAPTKWYKKWWGVLVLLILFFVAVVVVACTMYIVKVVQEVRTEGASINTAQKIAADKKLIEGENNYWLGTSTPRITIVEFSDFACPYCQDNFSVVRELGFKYQNEIKIIYRDYIGHNESMDLALAARCAGEQGKFWPMHDKLFTNQDQAGLTNLPIFAQQLGLDVKAFNSCLSNKKYLSDVRVDMDAADKIGITKTPSWMINGYLLEGAIGREDFIKIIDSILAK
jgi:protein-disulfide isomerase